MKAIAKLKDDARRHEQKEEWEKAINAYLQVLHLADQGDSIEFDLPLYNRVGDLYVRLGRERDAVKYYEQAADRYAEAGLYNNAIALCNKALRFETARLELLKKLGAFSASQGFFTDARRWYLEYAEKSIKRGEMDDAIAAMSELAQVTDDAEIRELLARQLRDHGRNEQAVEEYKRAYAMRVAAGQEREATAIAAAMHALDPAADVNAPATPPKLQHGPSRFPIDLPGFSDASIAPSQPAGGEPATDPQADELSGITVQQPPAEESTPDVVFDEFEQFDAALSAGQEPLDDPVSMFEFEVAEPPLAMGPIEVEEEPELFDLRAFNAFGSVEEADADDLPLLEGAGYDRLEAVEPLSDLEGLETEDRLLGADAGELDALDIGEIEQDELGLAGAPLPTLDLDVPPEPAMVAEQDFEDHYAPQTEAAFQPDHELEFWTQPSFGTPTAPAPRAEPEPDAEMAEDAPSESEAEPILEWEAESTRFDREPLEGEPETSELAEAGDAIREADTAPDTLWEMTPAAEIESVADAETDGAAEPDSGEAEFSLAGEVWADEGRDAAPEPTWSEFDADLPIDLTEPRFAIDEPDARIEFELSDEQPAQSTPGIEPEITGAGEAEYELVEPSEAAPTLDVGGFAAASAVELETFDVSPPAEVENTEPAPLAEASAFEAGTGDRPEADFQPHAVPEDAAIPPGGIASPYEVPPHHAKTAESDYINLSALLGEDEEETTDSTRFVVAERPPTGDEEKDFADMLQQFKQKVAETIPREDAGSHYDLGLAFKEMGLIEEAIGEFQIALRSGHEKLKLYEELGSCFVLKQQYGVAITVLNRAQQMPCSDESELLGVYYNLGRAHEGLGQRAEAKAAYEKIIGIDISFQDTSARLARL